MLNLITTYNLIQNVLIIFLDYTFWLIFFFFFFFFNHLSRQSALPVSLLLQFQKESFENILTLRFIITIFFFGQNMVLFSLYYNVSNTRIFFFFLQPRVKFASFECYFYLN